MTDRETPAAASPAKGASSLGSPRAELSLFDAASIGVGIVIGAGIYEAMPNVAANTSSVGMLILAWLLGGLVAMVGALCYAELASAFPNEGGDYVYLRRAYGPSMSFVFAWAELWVVGPGSIGAVAFVFARYANRLFPLPESISLVTYAAGAIVLLTLVNIVGVRESKWTQNFLTAAKVLGLMAIVVVAFLGPRGAPEITTSVSQPGIPREPDFQMAMIFVLFTYGGWNQIAFVAAEVRDARKNILRALLLSVGVVTVVYVLVTLASVYALGLDGLRSSERPAADVLELRLGDMAGRAISLLICVSSLGSINGQILTNGRIYAALGRDHRVFAWLGRWSARFGTPIQALLTQMAVTLIPIIAFGFQKDGFARLVNFTTPVFWFFFLLVGIAIFILRETAADTPRPYRVIAYPLTPLVFCLSSVMMLYSSFNWAYLHRSPESLWAICLVAIGYILSFIDWNAE